jgi:hypothetical protein
VVVRERERATGVVVEVEGSLVGVTRLREHFY